TLALVQHASGSWADKAIRGGNGLRSGRCGRPRIGHGNRSRHGRMWCSLDLATLATSAAGRSSGLAAGGSCGTGSTVHSVERSTDADAAKKRSASDGHLAGDLPRRAVRAGEAGAAAGTYFLHDDTGHTHLLLYCTHLRYRLCFPPGSLEGTIG